MKALGHALVALSPSSTPLPCHAVTQFDLARVPTQCQAPPQAAPLPVQAVVVLTLGAADECFFFFPVTAYYAQRPVLGPVPSAAARCGDRPRRPRSPPLPAPCSVSGSFGIELADLQVEIYEGKSYVLHGSRLDLDGLKVRTVRIVIVLLSSANHCVPSGVVSAARAFRRPAPRRHRRRRL